MLRDDAKAANGEPVTASDVKRSLERVARKSVGSLSTDLLSVIYGFSDFTVNDAIPALEGIAVVDEKTLRFDLDLPFGDLPLLLGNVTFGVTHYGASDQTYTTGPYMIKTITDPNHVVLGKAPGSTGLLDAINVTYYPDVNASYEAFTRNEVDWTPVAPDKAADAAKAYGAQLYRTSLRTLYLSFNLENPKLVNAQFPQALVQAIDRNAVVAALGGTARAIDGISPDIPGHQNGGCGAPCAYSVERSKALLAQAFPAGGIPPLTITAPAGAPLTDAAATRIVADLAAVGVIATVNRLPIGPFNSFTVDPVREIFQTSWSAAYPSGGAFLEPLFQTGSRSNVTGFKVPEVDNEILQAHSWQRLSSRCVLVRSNAT